MTYAEICEMLGTASTVISVSLYVLAVLAVGIGVLLGWKRGLYKSLVRLGGVIVAAILAVLTSKLVTWALSAVMRMLARSVLERFIETESTDAVIALCAAVISAIGALLLFLPLFVAFVYLLFIPEHFIIKAIRKTAKKPKGDIYWGMGISAASALIIFCLVMLPVSGTVAVIGEAADIVAETEIENNDTFDKIVGIKESGLDSVSGNAVIKFTSAVGRLPFNTLTSVSYNGASAKLGEETVNAAKLFTYATPFTDAEPSEYGEEQAEAFRNITEIIAGSKLFASSVDALVPFAVTALEESMKLSGGDIPEFADELMNVLRETTGETVGEDLKCAADLFDVLVRYSAFETVAAGGTDTDTDYYELIKTDGFISDIMAVFYPNPRFRKLSAIVVNEAITQTGDELGFDESKAQSLKLDADAFPSLAGDALKKECDLLEDIACAMYDYLKSAEENEDIMDSDLPALGRAFDMMKTSVLIGDKTDIIIEAVLRSETLAEEGIFSEETIQLILSSDASYENIIASAQSTAKLAAAMKNGNSEGSKENVKWLAEHLDITTAQIMSSAVSSDLLSGFGLSGSSAEKLSGIIGDFMLELASSDNLTDLQTDAEASCLDCIYNLANAAANGEDFFGGAIPSAYEMTDTFMTSDIFSECVLDAVYSGDEIVEDLLDMKDKIPAEDLRTVENTITDYIGENYGKATDKEAFRRKITALASIFDLDIENEF